jgi:uncharacterized protein (TIRG00374 family)
VTESPPSGDSGIEARPRGDRGRRRLLQLFKVVLALGLLGWVGSRLPWSDSLTYVSDPQGAKESTSMAGVIRGGWREKQVMFDLEPDTTAPASWPAAAREQVEAGRELVARELREPGFEWRPGMPRVFLDLQGAGLLTALLGLLLGLCFGVTRWWRLLNLAGCPSTWAGTLRLTFLGLFFNLLLPGLTGGDLPKAVLAVREHPERRADAFATVVIDRLIGLWALLGIANAVLWTTAGFEVLRIPAGLVLALLSLGLVLVLLPGPRQAVKLDRLIERLPQARRIQKLEQAALVFRGRPGELGLAVLLSCGNHFAVIIAVHAIGSAFGDSLSLRDYIGIVPVANVISSVPISPGGWGVGEAIFGTLFEKMGDVAAIGVAVSVTYRVCNMALGLIGGLFMLLPGGSSLRHEVLEAEAEWEN